MSSGYGSHGTEGRCYQFWMNFEKCMVNTDNPYKCDLLKEDYIECLHHRKEKDRSNMVEVENRRQEKIREKEERKEWKAAASQKH
ncbi:hypothetical protein BLSTO_00752 [Blastocystis sp. subtype 1]